MDLRRRRSPRPRAPSSLRRVTRSRASMLSGGPRIPSAPPPQRGARRRQADPERHRKTLDGSRRLLRLRVPVRTDSDPPGLSSGAVTPQGSPPHADLDAATLTRDTSSVRDFGRYPRGLSASPLRLRSPTPRELRTTTRARPKLPRSAYDRQYPESLGGGGRTLVGASPFLASVPSAGADDGAGLPDDVRRGDASQHEYHSSGRASKWNTVASGPVGAASAAPQSVGVP